MMTNQHENIIKIVSEIFTKTKRLKEYYNYLLNEDLGPRLGCFIKEQYHQKSRFLIELEREWYQLQSINSMIKLNDTQDGLTWITANSDLESLKENQLLKQLLIIENKTISCYKQIKRAYELPNDLMRVIDSQLDEIKYTSDTINKLEDLPVC
ncbi:hypothetical protein [Zunongwangia sp.]|uniref:hypothetical protein n=1 Tax=Zunongwangia sp. TaxID=1965325 RepID=UPI003AA97820